MAAVAVAACVFLQDAEARRERIRLTTLAPKDTSFHKSLMRMGNEWKKATDGDVSLQVFAGGIQGGESAMIDRMRVNQTQAALLTGVGLAEIDDGVAGLQQIPLMYRDYEELEFVMERLGETLNRRIEEKGFVVLGWMDSGWVRIFSKKPIQTPEDMKKGKLFTWAGDTKQTDLLKSLGFRPVPIDSTEIASSLQTGLIDTVPLPPFYGLALQSYKPAPYLLKIEYSPIVGALLVSKKTWDAIDPAHQERMREIAKASLREMTEAGRKENEDAIHEMATKFGLQVQEETPEIRSAWSGVGEEAYSLIRGNTVPADVFDEVVRLLAEYRSGE